MATKLLVLMAILLATCMTTDAFIYSSNPTWPYTLQVLSPSGLAGNISYGPPTFGPTIPAGGLTLPVRRLNDLDSPFGCVPTPTHTEDNDGQSLAGTAVLVARGRCVFDDKVRFLAALGASFVIVVNTEGAGLTVMVAQDDVPVPVIIITYEDGQQLLTTSAANPITIHIEGSGALVPAEKAALNLIVNKLSFDGEQSVDSTANVRSWATQVANGSRDPCIDRMNGIWCENGHITYLQVESNNFAANPLPAELDAFTKLGVLSVASNQFYGPLPCLPSLTRLAQLDVSSNAFTSIPDCTIAGAASSLVFFKARTNLITQISPLFASLPVLQTLDLSDNLIAGSIPPVTNLVSLTSYLVNNNQFNGTLPRFNGLNKLLEISVRNNLLKGTIDSDHFDGCTQLTSLDLAYNSFAAPLPDLNGCTNMLILDLSYNQFRGVLPAAWGLMTQVTSLIVSNNQLLSPFYDVIAAMTALETIDMSYNQLTSYDGLSLVNSAEAILYPLASSAGTLVSVAFSNNNFNGTFDAGYCCEQYPKLRELDISHNEIEGELPYDLFGYALSLWDSSFNEFSGEIPTGIPTTRWGTIKFDGNPQLASTSSSLPSWVKINSESLLKEAGTLFLCPSLSSNVRASAIVTIDASYYTYTYCQCDSGTYGTPPQCQEIPVVGTTPVPVNTTGFTWSSEGYGIITDSPFGSSRVKPGMDTSWLINTTAMLMSTGEYRPNTSPVLGVKITLQFTGSFQSGTGNSLGIYEGGTDLSGTRTAFFVGDGTSNAMNASVWVLSDLATINFQSRETAGTHFSASVLFAYTCPDGYFVSAGKCVAENKSQYRDFQQIFGVLVLLWQCISMAAAALLLWFKRNERQVGLQSVWFLSLSILGFFFIIEPPITGIVDDAFPCGVTYWFDLLWQPILMTCVFMIMGRLYIFQEIQKAKRRLLNKKQGQKMDPKKTARIAFLGSLVTQQRQILLTVALMALPLLTIIISYGAFTNEYTTDNTNCREDTRLDVIQLIYWIVYEIALIVGLVALKESRDAFGLSRRIGQFAMYYSVISVVYFVLKFAARDSQIDPFDFRYLEWFIVALFQIFFIVKPLLKTMPLFQRSIDEKDVEPLDEMLATKLGFAYMQRHCEEEFSVENILCWADIEKFKRKTTIPGFQIIVEKFIGPKAQMQVNIARTMEKKVLELNEPDKLQALGTALQTVLDEIQTELFNLILRDSYPRFLASPLAKRYVQKLPLPHHENDTAQSVSGAGGGHTGASDEHNSTGSRGGEAPSHADVELAEKKGAEVSISVSGVGLKSQASQSPLLDASAAVSP